MTSNVFTGRAGKIKTIAADQRWSKTFLKQGRDLRKLKCLQAKRVRPTLQFGA